MQRPSVLFVNRVYPPARGASGRLLKDLARAMALEGWDVTVLTTGDEASENRENGVQVIRVKAAAKSKGVFGYIGIWRSLFKRAKAIADVHLLVTMTDPPLMAIMGQKLCKAKDMSHIHWCQDLYPDLLPVLGFRFPKFLLRRWHNMNVKAMQSCDKVIVIGRCMAKRLTKKGVPPGQITVIPNWPDMELVVPADRDAFNDLSQSDAHEQARVSKSAIPEGVADDAHRPHEEQIKGDQKFRVLYAGNLGRAHPVEGILDAAEILRDENPEIEFVFVGDGPKFEMITEERSKRHLTNVRLMPYQPLARLRTTMESGDLHLISVKEEAAGLVVPSKLYSALAVGRPTIFIGAVQTETAKVLRDFGAGAVVAQGDVLALVQEIRRYRYSGEDWFNAHEAALEAGRIFVPRESLEAWIERAWGVVEKRLRRG